MDAFRRSILTVALSLLVCTGGLSQQGQLTLDDASRQKVVDEIARLLGENYVFPDVAAKCGEHISAGLKAGEFKTLQEPSTFAEALTKELQSISKDKHMRVRVRGPEGAGSRDNPALERYLNLRGMAARNFGFRKVEVLEGNVGYLDLTGFPPVGLARGTAIAAMKLLSNVDALIVDERDNGGGNPDTIQLICSYFFDQPTHLNSLYWRRGNRTQEFWTLEAVEGTRMPDVPLFVLTSKRTFSGGEEFAYNLKTRKRATLIGEVTGGGANPGGDFPLPFGLRVFIPTGRAINPVTKTNWEGTGVEPDIRTDAAEALPVALEKARAAAQSYGEAREKKARDASATVDKRLAEAESSTSGAQADVTQLVRSSLDLGVDSGLLDEISINDLGYRYLNGKKHRMAIAVFDYNVRRYPGSSNVYDSLGEAYMKDGQREPAVRMYRKSLELDPKNSNAIEMIRKLEAPGPSLPRSPSEPDRPLRWSP